MVKGGLSCNLTTAVIIHIVFYEALMGGWILVNKPQLVVAFWNILYIENPCIH